VLSNLLCLCFTSFMSSDTLSSEPQGKAAAQADRLVRMEICIAANQGELLKVQELCGTNLERLITTMASMLPPTERALKGKVDPAAVTKVYDYICSKSPSVAFSCLVKIACHVGDVSAAENWVKLACEGAAKNPKLRLFTPLLRLASMTKDVDLLNKTWQKIKVLGLDPGPMEFDYRLKCGGYCLGEVLQDLADVLPVVPLDSPLASTLSEIMSPTEVCSTTGVCSLTGARLTPFNLTQGELETLAEQVSSLAPADSDFTALVSTLSDSGVKVYIDGANVAHFNQNHSEGYFRHDQIEECLLEVTSTLGYSRAEVRVVLHSKWMAEDVDLHIGKHCRQRKKQKKGEGEGVPGKVCPEIVKKYRELWADVLLEVPRGLNDDWVWMCCTLRSALKGPALVVTNDLMRDHLFQMMGPRTFSKFRERHVCSYSLKHTVGVVEEGDVAAPPVESKVWKLCPPGPFTVRAQCNKVGDVCHWHVPLSYEIVAHEQSECDESSSVTPDSTLSSRTQQTTGYLWLVSPSPPT
jgi:hypothetical protein